MNSALPEFFTFLPPGSYARAVLDLLTSSKLFRNASPEELTALRNATQVRQFTVGERVFAEGDDGDGIYVIKSGWVRISAVVNQDQPRMLSRIGPGEFFGEMAVLDNEPRSATVTAEEPLVTGFIPRDALMRVLESSPRLAGGLVREFSLRLRDFNRQYITEAIEAERLSLVGRFARTIVHDFKNPLNVISLASELVATEKATPEMRMTAKRRISKQVERLSNMINELLDFTRGTQAAAVMAPVDYPQFIQQLIEEVQPELADRRVSISCDSPPPAVTVLIDPPRLMRVFFNLINNAVDVMPEGGRITLHFLANADELVTEIEDSGPGIAPKIAPRMFEPFATHGKAHGTGLGLAICRRIIEDHRGRIFVRHELGHGAIMVFTLPLAERASRSGPFV